jgi:hypothetical protein
MTVRGVHGRETDVRAMEERILFWPHAPDTLDCTDEAIGPFGSQFRSGAQLTPEIPQGFDIGRIVIPVRLEQLLQPFAANGGFDGSLGDDGYKCFDCPLGGRADRTGGTIHVLQCRRDLLQEQHGALCPQDRIIARSHLDFGDGLLNPGQRGFVPPAERAAAESGGKGPRRLRPRTSHAPSPAAGLLPDRPTGCPPRCDATRRRTRATAGHC